MDAFIEWGTSVWGQGEVVAVFAPSLATDPGAKEVMGAFERAAFSPGAFRDLMEVVSDIDIRPVLPTISVPTLVLHRTGDAVTSILQGRILAESIPGARLVELAGDDHLPQAGDAEAIVAEVQEFLTGVRPAPASDRVLATVLFTDIVGSTEAAAGLGDAEWRRRLDRHDAIMREHLAAAGGREVKTTGDGFLATFDGPARAIRCAAAASRALAQAGIPIRAGLHTGEVERRGDDIGGIAVHVAARVAALAGTGEVLVSRTVRDLVAGSGITFADRGEHRLKGVPEEWRLYAVGTAP